MAMLVRSMPSNSNLCQQYDCSDMIGWIVHVAERGKAYFESRYKPRQAGGPPPFAAATLSANATRPSSSSSVSSSTSTSSTSSSASSTGSSSSVHQPDEKDHKGRKYSQIFFHGFIMNLIGII
jgi:hypothetical protein